MAIETNIPPIVNHEGGLDHSPAVNIRPRSPADHGKPHGVDGLRVNGSHRGDGLKLTLKHDGWQASAGLVRNAHISGVWHEDGAVDKDGNKLHTDCLQIRNPDGSPIPLDLDNVRLEAGQNAEALNCEGKYTTINANRLSANKPVKFKVECTEFRLKNSPGVKLYLWEGTKWVIIEDSPGAVVLLPNGGVFPRVTVLDPCAQVKAELARAKSENQTMTAEMNRLKSNMAQAKELMMNAISKLTLVVLSMLMLVGCNNLALTAKDATPLNRVYQTKEIGAGVINALTDLKKQGKISVELDQKIKQGILSFDNGIKLWESYARGNDQEGYVMAMRVVNDILMQLIEWRTTATRREPVSWHFHSPASEWHSVLFKHSPTSSPRSMARHRRLMRRVVI